MEVLPSEEDLPFTCHRVRVGIGGDYIDVQCVGDGHVTRLSNIADGETFDMHLCRVLGSDCKNIVIMK